MSSTRPVPLSSASAGDKLDDARLYLSNLLALGDADEADIDEAREAVRKYSRAVTDSRKSWRRDAVRLDDDGLDAPLSYTCGGGAGSLAELESRLDRETL